MTIRKGDAWGAPGALTADGIVVRRDAEAGAVVTEARRGGRPVPPLGLLGGDLCKTVGGRGDEGRLRSASAVTFPCDLGEVLLDGRLHWFVAHLVARGPWWRGRAVVVMNAAWLGDWNLGPSAHPNDGLLDIAEAELRPSEVLAVRRRLPTGSHLPHPRIRTRRVKAAQWRFDQPTRVRLDGVVVGRFRDVSVRTDPDALTIVV